VDPHPPPPPDLHKLSPGTVTLETTVTLWRVYRLAGAPLFFGRTATQRFDDPAGTYGVLYASESPHGAFIESVGWDTGRRAVGWDELGTRGVVLFRPRRKLRVFDLDGPALRQMGADARLIAGGDHAISRTWSAALHAHPHRVDGLRYRARHDNREFSLALFDRCKANVVAFERRALTAPNTLPLLAELLDHYGMGLL